ncbi:phosphopantetheine-binding protein [Salinibacterium sp.]|uniref:acyl carrier protein n=1 Tax=Salinibacterium sp. TaxID=1915057 RepID=UPI00286CFC46|nr:phosphopantetheine-binding protein [Salinibacterium sp.]
MEQSEFIRLIAEILEVDADTVTAESLLDDLDWDSMSNLSFIAELDDTFGITVTSDELANASTVADLFALTTRGGA